MARHEIRSARPKPAKPEAELKAAPSFYERTHPVGSAERFLDEAAKEALAAAAAGGVITPRQAAVGAVRAVAKEAGKYPDPLLAEASALPREELMKRAARAAAYEQAMRAQNAVADVVSTSMSPVAGLARSQTAAAIATRQDWGGGKNTVSRVEFANTTEREKARKKAIADAEREAARPRIGGVSKLQQKAMAEADEALRLSTGIGRKGWLAVPGEKWDKLDQLEKERLVKVTQDAKETGAAYAVPAMVSAVPRQYYTTHALTGEAFLKAVDNGALVSPSLAVVPAKNPTTPLLTYPYSRRPQGYPSVFLQVPDTVYKGNPMAVVGSSDLSSPTMKALERYFNNAKDSGYFGKLGFGPAVPVSAADSLRFPGEFVDKSFDEVVGDAVLRKLLYDRVRNVLAYDNPAMAAALRDRNFSGYVPGYDGLYVANGSTMPERVPLEFGRALDKGPYVYGEAKVMDDVPISRVLGPDGAVGLFKTPYMEPAKVGQVVEKLEASRTPYRWVDPIDLKEMRGLLRPHEAAKGGHTARAAQGAGDTAGTSRAAVPETPVSESPVQQGGPRIVINPTTFKNSKDALCVAFNEGFRLWMEAAGFEPQSEPTDAQRKFFSDTAYADDEVQLRRTILARIATFDTSVKDPTDDQLAETGSFLDAILESDWCKNDWERNAVSRLSQAVKASVGAEPVEPRPEPIEPREPEPLQAKADLGGGNTDDEKKEGSEPPQEPAEPQDPQEPAEPENIEQPEEPAPQDAQGGAQEPAGAQGAVQPGNEQVQPQNAPQGQEEPSQPERQSGLRSGVWTGGEEGKGRQLTAREAEWMRQRIESGATVSGQQLAMFGLQRNERGALVNGEGNAFQGFGGAGEKSLPGAPDAKLDAGRGDRPAATPARKIGDIGAKAFTNTKAMNGPSIEPARPIGTIDTTDGSGGPTLRRKERRRSRI